MFSARTPADLAPNRLSSLLARLKAEGTAILDLTVSNPTRVGLSYPPSLVEAWSQPAGLNYEPCPAGHASARAAVAALWAREGIPIDPAYVLLTASTSEAYSLLFKLLCDPGDAILVPRPSYPLVEHLAQLDAVRCAPYRLDYHGCWSIDFPSLEEAATARTRAVVVVSPNNPTGSVTQGEELDRLSRFCAERRMALIGDEVFASYGLHDGYRFTSVLSQNVTLTFALGGLSKLAGLPQAKLSWIGVSGPRPSVETALARLEFIADSYLSVSDAVQHALPRLLSDGAGIRSQIERRARGNFERLRALSARYPSCEVLHAEAGWYAAIRVPSLRPEEELALELLSRDAVLVHPGYFFDFPGESVLVVSLLPEPHVFATAIERTLERACVA
jgi:aspartate/methionine/tyrosine aminotransferase